MRPVTRSATLAAAASAALLLAACGSNTAASTGSGAANPSPLIHTQSIKVGSSTMTVLKNTKGLTLYYFTPDTATTVACTGSCASAWPPVVASADNPTSSPSLPGHLTVIAGANGNQVAYNGHPLYTYSKDGDSGDAYGQGLFGKWFVATPDLAMAAAPSASASKSGYSNPY